MKNLTMSCILIYTLLGAGRTGEQDLGENGSGGAGGESSNTSSGNSTSKSGESDGPVGSGTDPKSNNSNPPKTDTPAQPTGAGTLQIKNLNASLLKGRIQLTFSLENGTNKTAETCQLGTITTSTGHATTADFGYDEFALGSQGFTSSGRCRGFMNETDHSSFCSNHNLRVICDPDAGRGLLQAESSSVLELSAYAANDGFPAWEQLGTEYQLKIRFLMNDAELVEASAKATLR